MLRFFRDDHPVFERYQYSSIDGVKHDWSQDTCPDSVECREQDRLRFAALRTSLAEIVGCDNTLNLLLRLAAGDLSYCDIADELGVHRSTVLRWVRQYHDRLRRNLLSVMIGWQLSVRGVSVAGATAGESAHGAGRYAVCSDVSAQRFVGLPSRQEIDRWLTSHADLFTDSSEPRSLIVAWRGEDGAYHLCAAWVFPHLVDAEMFRSENPQTSVFDLKTRKPLVLEREQLPRRVQGAEPEDGSVF